VARESRSRAMLIALIADAIDRSGMARDRCTALRVICTIADLGAKNA